MTREIAIAIVDQLEKLRVTCAVGVSPQEHGGTDWTVIIPPGQDFDLTDVATAAGRLNVRVKLADGKITFFPPPAELSDDVEEAEPWASDRACIHRFGHPCSRLPCEVCGNGHEWIVPDSVAPGVTDIDPAEMSRMGAMFQQPQTGPFGGLRFN